MFKPSISLPTRPCISSSLRQCIHHQPKTRQTIKRSISTTTKSGAVPLTVNILFERYNNPLADARDPAPGVAYGDTRFKLALAREKHFDYVLHKMNWMDKEIYLVGVAHFSDESRMHIKESILNIRPDTLVLELTDKNPYERLLERDQDDEDSNRHLSVFDSKSIKLFTDIEGLNPSTIDKANRKDSGKAVFEKSDNLEKLLSLSGVLASTAPSVQTPEILEAFLFAKHLLLNPTAEGSFLKNVVLADRDPVTSFSRLYTLLPTKYKFYFIVNNVLMTLFNRKSRRAQALKELPDIDFSTLVEYDQKSKGFIHPNNVILQYTDMFERDLLFLHALKNAPGKKILGIFGMAHIHGIKKFWEDQVAAFLTTDNNLDSLKSRDMKATPSVFFDLFKTHYGTDVGEQKK